MDPLVKVRGLVYPLNGAWAYFVFLKFFDGDEYKYPHKAGFPTEKLATELCNAEINNVVTQIELIFTKDKEQNPEITGYLH